MNEIYHPPFNYNFPIDLGGTSYDFVKEYCWNKLVFYRRAEETTVKIEIPGDESFVSISSEGKNGPFFESHYDFRGELSAASFWLVRQFERLDFSGGTMPHVELLETIDYLRHHDMDIILTADVESNDIYVAQCIDVSVDEYPQVINDLSLKIPQKNSGYFHFYPLREEDENETIDIPSQVRFNVGLYRDSLELSLSLNNISKYGVSVSTRVDFKNLGIKSTPKDMTNVLDHVFRYAHED